MTHTHRGQLATHRDIDGNPRTSHTPRGAGWLGETRGVDEYVTLDFPWRSLYSDAVWQFCVTHVHEVNMQVDCKHESYTRSAYL